MSEEHDDKLHRIRHSASHVMAQAVLEDISRRQDRHRPGHRGRLLL